MDLVTFWFILLAVLWTGYLVLEGFDFGVGMLVPVLGGTKRGPAPEAQEQEKKRRVLLTTIGPHWDGNEVWLLTAGGATFAAFPHWYATMFSGMYLALLLILVALIVRNMGFEYRYKRDSESWRTRWDAAIIFGSIAAPLLVGTGLTNLVYGMPMEEHMSGQTAYTEFTGNLFSLLNPVSLLGGITITVLCLVHGAHFVALKTEGAIRHEARALATKAGVAAAVLAVLLLLWLGIMHGSIWSWITTVLAAGALLAAIFFNLKDAEGKAFVGTSLTILFAVATYFLMLFPNAINGRGEDPALTLEAAASSPLTLKIMTGAALVFTPIMLIYTVWSYWVFRKRISTEHIATPVEVNA
ncbi:cytochrome d ubiquinol oxidase subunit II [Marihabitans asiaticum]|uniref:Cytochrome bd-I ubiquinol oxidase subunit 2 apoprotein n=1 Tax=Marihabitans asiaticum TaxID=415218 RepID=A0A560WEH9_9MICO|nr:cytochrome d ubiquinol oxidase subunit II [Marihabitans asiaticum]TWD15895.1 cytochrome bd-I ubiquinol oxidase subunit 2 apoprotein [Marihabitans asiaticum]